MEGDGNFKKFIEKLEGDRDFKIFIEYVEGSKISISKLEKHLYYMQYLTTIEEIKQASDENDKKQLEKEKNEIVEIWDILIKRVETVSNKIIFDDNNFNEVKEFMALYERKSFSHFFRQFSSVGFIGMVFGFKKPGFGVRVTRHRPVTYYTLIDRKSVV